MSRDLKKIWTDKDIETLLQMWRDGDQDHSIARKLRRSRNSVIRKINRLRGKLGVEAVPHRNRHNRKKRLGPAPIVPDRLIVKALDDGLTARQAQEKFLISESALRRRANDMGRSWAPAIDSEVQKARSERMRGYAKQGLRVCDVAEIEGIAPSTVCEWRDKAGVVLKGSRQKYKKITPEGLLKALDDGLTATEAAARFNCSKSTCNARANAIGRKWAPYVRPKRVVAKNVSAGGFVGGMKMHKVIPRGKGLNLVTPTGEFLHMGGESFTQDHNYYWRGTTDQAQNMMAKAASFDLTPRIERQMVGAG